jgi:hypothetical protein
VQFSRAEKVSKWPREILWEAFLQRSSADSIFLICPDDGLCYLATLHPWCSSAAEKSYGLWGCVGDIFKDIGRLSGCQGDYDC